jgi:purine-binding chemotaxis protein CheW
MNHSGAQHVVFTIDENMYGIPIHDVAEIIRMSRVQWIPRSREELLGIIHLRDKVIPVISLHRLFTGRETELDAKTRIIIVHCEGKEVGIVVDAVERVKHLSGEHTSIPSHFSDNEWLTGIYHAGDEVITLLDVASLLEHMDNCSSTPQE